jgi:hypothetical protein
LAIFGGSGWGKNWKKFAFFKKKVFNIYRKLENLKVGKLERWKIGS